MNKVLAKNGARHDMEKLFDDLQLNTRNTIIQTLLGLVDTFGIVADIGASGIISSFDNSLQVTYSTPGYVQIAPGLAITSELHFLNVVSPATVPLTTAGSHTLYIKAKTVSSSPTAVMNGFKYTAGENTTPTRETDSYEFVWDTNPGIVVSGMVLADITINNESVVTLLTDRRSENILQRNTYIPYTSSDTFKIGGIDGASVLTAGETPTAPVKFVVTDVLPGEAIEHIDSSMSALLPIDMQKALTSTNVAVKLEWGTFEVTPATVEASGIITFDTGVTDASDSLIGLHMYNTATNKDYKIIDNTLDSGQNPVPWATNTIVVRNIDGSIPTTYELQGVYTIHPGAEFYEILAIPYDTGVLDERQRYEWEIKRTFTDVSGNLVTSPEGHIIIPLGQKYNIYVRSCNQFMKSSYFALQGSTYTKEEEAAKYYNGGIVTYTVPFVAKLADLNTGNASISAVPSYSGFKVAINPGSGSNAGWTIATAFEVLWSSAYGGVNLTTPNYQREVTYHTELDITTPEGRTYQVMVRPLVGGQIAGSALTAEVATGSGGAAPTDSTLVTVPINFRTYEGILLDSPQSANYYGGGDEPAYIALLDETVTPAYSGLVSVPITVVNGDFASATLSGWENGYGQPADDLSPGLQYVASGLEFLTGHAKLRLEPLDRTYTMCQAFTIPKNTTKVTFSFDIQFEGPDTYGSVFLTELNIGTAGQSFAGRVGDQILNQVPTFSTDVLNKTTLTITASIPSGNVGNNLWLGFSAAGRSSENYFHIDNITGTWLSSIGGTNVQLSREIIGDVLVDYADKEFIIVDVIGVTGSVTQVLVRPVSGSTGPPTAGVFKIGVSKRGRQIYTSRGILIDYLLTKAYFDCDALLGRKCRIRWYQEGTIGESLADSLLVTGSDQGFTQSTDVKILADLGNRNLIIDLYDDGTDPENYSGVTGTLVLYARPYLRPPFIAS